MVDVVRTAIATPAGFEDVDELPPILRTTEKLKLEAINLDLPPEHRLKPLENLKRAERVVDTLKRSAVEDPDPLCSGFDDEEVWRTFLSGGISSSSVLQSQQPLGVSHQNRLFGRLTRMLRAKFLDRRVLITEAGFVGVGVRQIEEGDVVTFPFGGNAPLVLRPRGREWAIVGCAYVSGLMEPEYLSVHLESGAFPTMELRIC